MRPDRWERLQALFEHARALPTDERAEYVQTAVEDEQLRAEVLSLLEADAASGRLDGIAERLGQMGNPDAASPEPLPTPTRVGPYQAIRPIGRGGMGTVFLAERADGQLRYTVALKLLRRDLQTDELRRRFLIERQILARIRHPNIAGLLDGGITKEGQPYFVMEHVEGLPIHAYCDAHHLPIPRRLELFRTVCSAVQLAHRNLIVHRDLKPANILVTAEGRVKLLDFGIAKVFDLEAFPEAAWQTQTGHRLMTPDYASPEQLRGDPVTTASDVYQLGLLLYLLLVGRLPPLTGPATHSGSGGASDTSRDVEKPSTVITSALDQAATPDPRVIAAARETSPDRLRRQLTGDLDNIALLALREEPERRYASVEQLSEDVRRHMAGLPVTARPESLGYVTAKFLARHRAGAAASLLAVVLLIAFAVGTSIQTGRVARERDRAQQVSRLLLEMFESASPDVSGGDTITVVQVLDRGVERVLTTLGGQPELQGTMLMLIADVYEDLGQLRQAIDVAREALAARLASLGPEHAETIHTSIRLASLLSQVGELDSALTYASRSAELATRHLGRTSLGTGVAYKALGYAHQLKGDLDPARSALTQAVAIFRATSGDSARLELASALVNLGWIDENERQLDSGIAKLEESVAIRRSLLPPDHPKLVNSVANLADLLIRDNELDAAEPLLAEVLTTRQRIYAAGHPNIAGAQHLYAKLLARTGELDRAERLYRDALTAYREAYGRRSFAVAQVLNDLGLFLHFERRDPAAAEPMLRESGTIFAEARGPSDAWTAIVESNLAMTVYLQGRNREAAAIFERTIPALERSYPSTSSILGRPLVHYGIVLTRLGRLAEAESALERGLDIARASEDTLRIAEAQEALADLYARRGPS